MGKPITLMSHNVPKKFQQFRSLTWEFVVEVWCAVWKEPGEGHRPIASCPLADRTTNLFGPLNLRYFLIWLIADLLWSLLVLFLKKNVFCIFRLLLLRNFHFRLAKYMLYYFVLHCGLWQLHWHG